MWTWLENCSDSCVFLLLLSHTCFSLLVSSKAMLIVESLFFKLLCRHFSLFHIKYSIMSIFVQNYLFTCFTLLIHFLHHVLYTRSLGIKVNNSRNKLHHWSPSRQLKFYFTFSLMHSTYGNKSFSFLIFVSFLCLFTIMIISSSFTLLVPEFFIVNPTNGATFLCHWWLNWSCKVSHNQPYWLTWFFFFLSILVKWSESNLF